MPRRDRIGLALVTGALLVLVVREIVRTPASRAASRPAEAIELAGRPANVAPGTTHRDPPPLVTAPPSSARSADLDALRLRIDAARAMAAARATASFEARVQINDTINDALTDAMRRSDACWPAAAGEPPRVANLVLISDDQLGLFVDTSEITNAAGEPLPRAVDDCIRDAIDGMALRGTYFGGRVTEHWHFDE